MFFKRLYEKIPSYGRLMLRRGSLDRGWYKTGEDGKYFSVRLKGQRKGWFRSRDFYAVFTERGLEEAIKRGETNRSYVEYPSPFGRYVGIQSVVSTDRFKQKYNCVFLKLFRYVRGGDVEEIDVALSERQFRRAVVRARKYPDLPVKFHFWHAVINFIHVVVPWL